MWSPVAGAGVTETKGGEEGREDVAIVRLWLGVLVFVCELCVVTD